MKNKNNPSGSKSDDLLETLDSLLHRTPPFVVTTLKTVKLREGAHSMTS